VRFPVHLSPSPHRVFLCAFATTEPPYIVPHPKELTHRLCNNWLQRWAQNRPRSHRSEPAQVEQNMPSTCNINSELVPTMATSTVFSNRRGECNIPKRYLKEAEWFSDGYLGEGYYTSDPDSDAGGLSVMTLRGQTMHDVCRRCFCGTR
jgi:hypothetical protein